MGSCLIVPSRQPTHSTQTHEAISATDDGVLWGHGAFVDVDALNLIQQLHSNARMCIPGISDVWSFGHTSRMKGENFDLPLRSRIDPSKTAYS